MSNRRARISRGRWIVSRESMPHLSQEALEFQIMTNTRNVPCVYCREDRPDGPEEVVRRLRERVKKDDAIAMNQLGDCYMKGLQGVNVDITRGIELYKKSYNLGSPDAAYRLWYYSPEEEKAEYLEVGVRRSHLHLQFEYGKECLRKKSVGEAYKIISGVYREGYSDAFATLFQMCLDDQISERQLSRAVSTNRRVIDSLESDWRKYARRFISHLASLNSSH